MSVGVWLWAWLVGVAYFHTQEVWSDQSSGIPEEHGEVGLPT